MLRDDGLLAFTFHQSKLEGWVHLTSALTSAQLVVTSVQPVKAEMSTAAPKSGAREPSNLDSIVVCRKLAGLGNRTLPADARSAASIGFERIVRIASSGLIVGAADCRSVIWGSVLTLGTHPNVHAELTELAVEAQTLGDLYVERFLAEQC